MYVVSVSSEITNMHRLSAYQIGVSDPKALAVSPLHNRLNLLGWPLTSDCGTGQREAAIHMWIEISVLMRLKESIRVLEKVTVSIPILFLMGTQAGGTGTGDNGLAGWSPKGKRSVQRHCTPHIDFRWASSCSAMPPYFHGTFMRPNYGNQAQQFILSLFKKSIPDL